MVVNKRLARLPARQTVVKSLYSAAVTASSSRPICLNGKVLRRAVTQCNVSKVSRLSVAEGGRHWLCIALLHFRACA